MIRFYWTLIFIVSFSELASAQQVLPLYRGNIPNAKPSKDESYEIGHAEVDSLLFKVSRPTISVYLPEAGKANGAAVIICPGGGYHTLLIKREGSDVARAFNEIGVTAFVLKYRLPDDAIMNDKSVGPLQDVQQAILLVRARADEWDIDPNKIGLMGFSAGGHLAATAGTHPEVDGLEGAERVSSRPDFMMLINPVISFRDSIGHIGSREKLLGKEPDSTQIARFSNELQVTKDTPPSFLVHSAADEVVLAENSTLFYQALRKNKVPAALHIYATGEHGFLTAPTFSEWFGRCIYWMQEMSLLTSKTLLKVGSENE